MVPGLTGQEGTISFESAEKPGYFLRHYGFLLYLEPQNGGRNPSIFDKDATFFLRKNKFFNCYYSFESVNYPGQFIRHQGYRLKISTYKNTELYKNDASFTPVKSISDKGMYLSQYLCIF